MAKQQGKQHGLSQVPSVAVDHNRREHHGGFLGGFRGRVLQKHLPHATLPRCHVRGHCGADWVHNLRIRCHGQRVGSKGDEPGLLRLLPSGLFWVVGGARGQ